MMKGAFDSSTVRKGAPTHCDCTTRFIHSKKIRRRFQETAVRDNICHAEGVYALATYRPIEHCCGGARLAQCQ